MNKASTKMANKKAKDYAFVAIMLLIPVIHLLFFGELSILIRFCLHFSVWIERRVKNILRSKILKRL